MDIVNCFWEEKNLGVKTVEITISPNDSFDEEGIVKIENEYDYVVIKVPMNHSDYNFGLTKLGYTLIETQLGISKTYNTFDFNDRFIKRLIPHISESVIDSEEDFEEVVSKITPNMFTTDRIYLDKYFSSDSSCNRYQNWMRTEFQANTGIIKKINYKDINVGYTLSREEDGVIRALLGGIFKDYQSLGIGILTPAFHFITAKNCNRPFEKMVTSISSNNFPVLELYNYLGFRIYQMTYVFIKHT